MSTEVGPPLYSSTNSSEAPSGPAGASSLISTSQASPRPSASKSACPTLGVVGQLSHASPRPSPSVSSWVELGMAGQLSQMSPTPSPSPSATLGWPHRLQLFFGGAKQAPAVPP